MQPGHVPDAIRFGIARGWVPGASGDDCWLAFDLDEKQQPLFEFIPRDDFRVATYPTLRKIPKELSESRFPDTRKWHERDVIGSPGEE